MTDPQSLENLITQAAQRITRLTAAQAFAATSAGGALAFGALGGVWSVRRGRLALAVVAAMLLPEPVVRGARPLRSPSR